MKQKLFRGKMMALIAVVAVSALLVAGAPLLARFLVTSYLRNADNHQKSAFKSFGTDDLNIATNALNQYMVFLRQESGRLSPYRDVDRLEYLSHSLLAYRLLAANEPAGAIPHLREAYIYHSNSQITAGLVPASPEAFPELVVKSVEYLMQTDLTSMDLRVHTNHLVAVIAKFTNQSFSETNSITTNQ